MLHDPKKECVDMYHRAMPYVLVQCFLCHCVEHVNTESTEYDLIDLFGYECITCQLKHA